LLDFIFYLPTRIIFGPGAIEKTGKEVAELVHKVIIVTGRTSARKMGFLQKVENSCAAAGVTTVLFEEVEPNPSLKTVERGTEVAKKENCQAIIGLGGGSALDAAKAIALLCANPPPLTQYFGKNKAPHPALPLIAIPTTAGTGSEVTPYAVLTNTEKEPHQKQIITEDSIFPRKTLIDPELTLSLPPDITTDTGIDALSHAVESYTSNRAFTLVEGLAKESITLLSKNLPLIRKNPENLQLRSSILYASLLAGLCIAQTGTILVHGMGYPLTSELGLTHGRANGLLLPWVCQFNLKSAPKKFAQLAQALGERTEDLTIEQAAEKSVEALSRLLDKLGIPKRLSPGLMKEEALKRFSQEMMKNQRKLVNNPRLPNLQDIMNIYRKIL